MPRELVGGLILYGPPALAGACFWGLVRWWFRHLDGRDTMAKYRPSRQRVARSERKLGVHNHGR